MHCWHAVHLWMSESVIRVQRPHQHITGHCSTSLASLSAAWTDVCDGLCFLFPPLSPDSARYLLMRCWISFSVHAGCRRRTAAAHKSMHVVQYILQPCTNVKVVSRKYAISIVISIVIFNNLQYTCIHLLQKTPKPFLFFAKPNLTW